VFVHGLAATADVWREQAERLQRSYRVVRYDLRSHGMSDAVDVPCTRADLASDLVDVLDRIGIERAVLVGHSAGGVVAMQAALDHPSRVSGLVLVGTASECNAKTADWYERTATTAREQGGVAAVEAMGLKGRSAVAPDGAGFAWVAMAMRSLHEDPLTLRLKEIRVPTLVLVGERDFLGVGGSVILGRSIQGSQLEILPGRGHGIYLEDPAGFAERLARFLGDLDAA
jgi:pimeloyl-ACP methyl ester carboxylesterase